MGLYLNIAQIIISVALVVVILMQTKSSGGLGGIFGGDGSVFRTRRGVERTHFNFTIVLSVACVVVPVLRPSAGR